MLQLLLGGFVLLLATSAAKGLEVFVEGENGERVAVGHPQETQGFRPCPPDSDHHQTIECLQSDGGYVVLPSTIQEGDEHPPVVQHPATAPHSVFEAVEEPSIPEVQFDHTTQNPEPMAMIGSFRTPRTDVKKTLITTLVVLVCSVGVAAVVYSVIGSRKQRRKREREERWANDPYGWWENWDEPQVQVQPPGVGNMAGKAESGLDWGTFDTVDIV